MTSCGQLRAVLDQQRCAYGNVENVNDGDARIRVPQQFEWKQGNNSVVEIIALDKQVAGRRHARVEFQQLRVSSCRSQ